MSEYDVIGKVSYNGRRGFWFTNANDLAIFSKGPFECTIRKDAIEAIEYRVFRNLWALGYALFVTALFVAAAMVSPSNLEKGLGGNFGSTMESLLGGLLVSAGIAFLVYLYPNSKLVIYAGSYKCFIDGKDEKLIQIAAQLQA